MSNRAEAGPVRLSRLKRARHPARNTQKKTPAGRKVVVIRA